jgi:tRNA (guanosine-2'-O-)-methyltransferase
MKFDPRTEQALLKQLREMILPERWKRFEKVLSSRTRHLTVVLEDIFQTHNASAVIRNCELMGIQDLHVIENENTYQINPDIVVGANKWIHILKHNEENNNTRTCFNFLRKEGYRIVATSPHQNDQFINELEMDQKTALVFGNEGRGLTDYALQNADAYVKIPMWGFTESYNLSVSVALTLYELLGRLRNSNIPWQLSAAQKQTLLLEYALKTIKNPDTFLKRMLKG